MCLTPHAGAYATMYSMGGLSLDSGAYWALGGIAVSLVLFVFAPTVAARAALGVIVWVLILILFFGLVWQPAIPLRIICALGASAVSASVAWTPVCSLWRAEQAANTEGYFSQPNPSSVDPDTPIKVEIGDSGTILQWGAKNTSFMRIAYDSHFELSRGEDGIEITTTIRDKSGQIIVQIDGNHWRVNPTTSWDKNYTRHALEVLDARGHVVLQLRMLPDRVQVQGEWHDDKGGGFQMLKSPDRSKPGGLFSTLGPKNPHLDWLIPPMFRYPSSEHWGEYASAASLRSGETDAA